MIKYIACMRIGNSEGFSKSSSEIKKIEICHGNIPKGVLLPIHIIFPRLFTCKSVKTKTFKIEFEVKMIVYFESGHKATKSIPLILCRGKNHIFDCL